MEAYRTLLLLITRIIKMYGIMLFIIIQVKQYQIIDLKSDKKWIKKVKKFIWQDHGQKCIFNKYNLYWQDLLTRQKTNELFNSQ